MMWVKKIRGYVGDRISFSIFFCTHKMIDKVNKSPFSDWVTPKVIDLRQILRNDGCINSWSGGGVL